MQSRGPAGRPHLAQAQAPTRQRGELRFGRLRFIAVSRAGRGLAPPFAHFWRVENSTPSERLRAPPSIMLYLGAHPGAEEGAPTSGRLGR